MHKLYVFQENRSYALWVKTFDGSIPQRTEVLATITDKSGQRPKLPHPPPFGLPNYPGIPIQPKFPRPTQRTTKATEKYDDEVTVPDTATVTTLSPPKRPDDIPDDNVIEEDKKKNISKLPEGDKTNGNDVPLTVIPLIAIGGLVIIVAAVIVFVWKKNSPQRASGKKDDMVSHLTLHVTNNAYRINVYSHNAL